MTRRSWAKPNSARSRRASEMSLSSAHWQVRLILEREPATEVHRFAIADSRAKAAVPYEQLLEANTGEVEHQRHARHGQVRQSLATA